MQSVQLLTSYQHQPLFSNTLVWKTTTRVVLLKQAAPPAPRARDHFKASAHKYILLPQDMEATGGKLWVILG